MNAITGLPFDEDEWELAGELDASLRSKGITIPPVDLLIAQVCIRHNVPIFTLDAHFEKIEKLRLYKI